MGGCDCGNAGIFGRETLAPVLRDVSGNRGLTFDLSGLS